MITSNIRYALLFPHLISVTLSPRSNVHPYIFSPLLLLLHVSYPLPVHCTSSHPSASFLNVFSSPQLLTHVLMIILLISSHLPSDLFVTSPLFLSSLIFPRLQSSLPLAGFLPFPPLVSNVLGSSPSLSHYSHPICPQSHDHPSALQKGPCVGPATNGHACCLTADSSNEETASAWGRG